MQKTGATVSSSLGREEIVYKIEGIEDSMPKLIELISDSILNTRLHEYDLPPKKDLVEYDILEYAEEPLFILNEMLHKAAFGEKGLGNLLV